MRDMNGEKEPSTSRGKGVPRQGHSKCRGLEQGTSIAKLRDHIHN